MKNAIEEQDMLKTKLLSSSLVVVNELGNVMETKVKKTRKCTTRNRPSGLTYTKDRIKTVRPKLGHYKKTIEKLEAWLPIMDQILLKVWTSADNKLHPDEFMTMKELEAKHGQDARQNFCNYFSRRTKHSEIKAAKHRENLDKGFINKVLYNKLMKHCMGSEYTLKSSMYDDVKRRLQHAGLLM